MFFDIFQKIISGVINTQSLFLFLFSLCVEVGTVFE
jgi:hypothetical protein